MPKKGREKETDATGTKLSKISETENEQRNTSPRKKICEKKKRNKKTDNKDVKHQKKTRKAPANTDEDDSSSNDGVFPCLGGPYPEFGLPYWSYDLDTEIKDILSGNTFKICSYFEGRVDMDGFPINKEVDAEK